MSTVPALGPLASLLDEARLVHPSMTVNQLMVFPMIAMNEVPDQQTIEERVDLSDASASRIIALLGQYGNRGTEPLNLIEIVPDANDRRRKSYVLTKKGRKLVERFMEQLDRYRGGPFQ